MTDERESQATDTRADMSDIRADMIAVREEVRMALISFKRDVLAVWFLTQAAVLVAAAYALGIGR